MTKVNAEKRALAERMASELGNIVTRKQVLAFVKANGGTIADVRWIFNTKKFRAGRGQYDLGQLNAVDAEPTEAPAVAVSA